MTTRQLFRLSGFALVIGAIVSAASSIVSSVMFPDNSNPASAMDPLSVLLSLIGVVATVLVLLGLPGMYLRAAREGGLLWLLGVVLISITGLIFGIFLGLMGVLVFPVLASRAPDMIREGPPPSFFALFIVATLANLFGSIFMAIPMLTKRIYPRWCGYLMIVEAVLAVAGFAVNGPSSTGLIGQVVSVVSPLPLFVVFGWAGYELWSSKAVANDVFAQNVLPQTA